MNDLVKLGKVFILNYRAKYQAKWYVRQLLDALDCEDQTNKNIFGINTCFYLQMSFEHLEGLTQECNESYINNVRRFYNIYIQKYINIINSFYNNDYLVDFEHALVPGIEWLKITLGDILNLEDSKDYPKGLRCNTDYWDEGMFEDYLDDYTLEDYKITADFFDSAMEALRNCINEQRQLDGI